MPFEGKGGIHIAGKVAESEIFQDPSSKYPPKHPPPMASETSTTTVPAGGELPPVSPWCPIDWHKFVPPFSAPDQGIIPDA